MARSSPTLADLGEARFLERIARLVPGTDPGVVGIGDDAAILPAGRGSVLLTTDALVEGTHFHRRWFRPEEAGFKALAVNLSDAAAMGGVPRFAAVSLILPGTTAVQAVVRLYRGMLALARRTGVSIVGGNVAEGRSVSVTIALLGGFPRGEPVLRSGSRPGDRLYVSGQPGLARLGCRLLQSAKRGGSGGRSSGTRSGSRPRKTRLPDLWEHDEKDAAAPRRELARSHPGGTAALKRFLTPEPRLALARNLQLYRPTAMIDVSDGLGEDLFHLAGPGRSLRIDPGRFSLPPAFRKLAGLLGEEPADAYLRGGEDYELLVALPAETAERLGPRAVLSGTALTAIGAVVPGSGVRLSGAEERTLSRSGFQHFRRRS
jgi:thiamine-monophosphate kinase